MNTVAGQRFLSLPFGLHVALNTITWTKADAPSVWEQPHVSSPEKQDTVYSTV